VIGEVVVSATSVDPHDVLRSLGYDETGEPERVLGGWDTLLWRFTTPDGGVHALRVYHQSYGPEAARRERIALEACARAELPAPRVERMGTFAALPVLVLTWCPGRTLLSEIERRPWQVWRLGRLFGQIQARIHAAPPPTELADGMPEEWIDRVLDEHRPLAEAVRRLAPATDVFIHMDYHPLNIICQGTVVTGIIDWAGAAAGDRRADLARTAATLLGAPVPPGPLKPLLNLARQLVLRAWRKGYEDVAGPMPDYEPFLAWAGATLLFEAEQVVDRDDVWGTREDLEVIRRLVEQWAETPRRERTLRGERGLR
jgi:aminoglycoside phosphotransferase (APT) family kinase protein